MLPHRIKQYTDVEKKIPADRQHTHCGYVHGPVTKGWENKKNTELVEQISGLLKGFALVEFVKVAGIIGIAENEPADCLTTSAIRDNTGRSK